MPSVSRMLARNWLPSPSPLLAPATSPAMSTNSTLNGFTGSPVTPSSSSALLSVAGTLAVLGRMVVNGLFIVSASWLRVSALNSVDLPMFGSPTIPTDLDPCRKFSTNSPAGLISFTLASLAHLALIHLLANNEPTTTVPFNPPPPYPPLPIHSIIKLVILEKKKKRKLEQQPKKLSWKKLGEKKSR